MGERGLFKQGMGDGMCPIEREKKHLGEVLERIRTIASYGEEEAMEATRAFLEEHDQGVLERAEQALLESEAAFHHLAEAMPTMVWTANEKGEVDYVTSRFTRYSNVPYEVLARGDWAGVLHPEDAAEAVEKWWKAFSSKQPYHCEYRLRRHDGVYRWHLVQAMPLISEDGRARRWYGSSSDIDDLRRMEALFRSAARATSDVIWDWDLLADVLWWSDGVHKAFGLSPAELGSDIALWKRRIHPEDHDRVMGGIERALESREETWQAHYRFQRSDGTYAWVMDRALIARDGKGRAVRMVGGMADETPFLENIERLREQAELLDRAQDAILVRALDHTILYANHGAERVYGWTKQEMVGASSKALLCTDFSRFDEAMQNLLLSNEWTGETVHRKKDGTTCVMECRLSLLRDAQGRPHRVLSINTDITERKKLLAQFLRAQRMESIGTLASGIAHDLNNVLTPILLAIDVLRSEIRETMLMDTLATIEASAQRGAEMVKQVLAFARGVEGAKVAISLDRVVSELVRVVRDTFPKTITMRTAFPPELWPIHGDPTQIHQVMLNLFVNARDAMPQGGLIMVSAENVALDEHYAAMSEDVLVGKYVRVSISDTGVGMNKEVMQKIFDPFFTTKEVGKGTGLGLSTVDAIMRSHGGFVNVYSEVGKGTTFRLYFPAAQQGGLSAFNKAATELKRGNGELILVVDDERSVREITEQTLEVFGYRVVTATDGADAVAVYARRGDEIALVLTDIMMPIMDGPTTIRALMRMNPHVLIIAASGLDGNGGVARAADAGVRHFLPKPYNAQTLLDTLHRVLHPTPSI